MSVRKCSFCIMRWCFFLDLDRSSFLADVECQNFSINIGEKYFFCRDGLMFSGPNKGEHASFGRNKTSVELNQKNLTDQHCTFFMQHQNKKTSSAVKKYIICQRAFLKRNCAMSAEKYQSSYFTTSTGIFFNQYRWKIFFCRDGLMFSWPNKCEYASFGRKKTSVELAQNNLADLHCKFFMQH